MGFNVVIVDWLIMSPLWSLSACQGVALVGSVQTTMRKRIGHAMISTRDKVI